MTTVSSRARPTALKAARMFDSVTATLRSNPIVVVSEGVITGISFTGEAPEGADVVDLGDATLLPGLVDTHVHLAFDASTDPVGRLGARSDDEVVAAMRHAGRTALAGGVTTVRDLGDRHYLSLGLRGEAGLPTILAAGPPITSPGGHCHFLGGVARPGVEGIREAVRVHAEHGVDVIKIMATGGQLTPGTRQDLPQFSASELRAAVDEAHRHQLPVTAHAHATQGVVDAVAAGVDGLEHASFWSATGVDDPGDVLTLLAQTRVAVGATIGVRPLPGAEPPPGVRERRPAIVANFRRMYAAGVVLVAGTDAGIAPVKPHDALRYALPQFEELGMSTAEALATMTARAADVIGLGERKGRLAVGYDADILAVHGNPLIESDALHRIRAVYGNGQLVSPGA